MKKYEEYKTTQYEWLGEVPAHWKILPLYAVAREKSICNCENLPLLSVYLDVGVIPFSEKKDKRTNATSKDLSKYQRVDPGDFVLNNQQAWRGSVGVSFYTGIVSPAYIVTSLTQNIDSKYANYLLRSRVMVDQYLINSKSVGSIQRNVYWPYLKRTQIIIPPMNEQTQIARFLDWKVAEIDRFIGIRKKQITITEELIKRLISDAVTRGVNSNASMQDTGIEWLGEVPTHWKQFFLQQVAKEKSVKNTGNVETTVLSLSYGKIVVKQNTLSGLLPTNYESYQIVSNGDIILRLTDLQNDHKSLRTGLVTQGGIITSAYTCLTPSQNSAFLRYLLHAYDLRKVFYGMGGGVRQSIGYKDIRHMYVYLPPLDEQEQIVDYISAHEEKLQKRIKQLKQGIEVLQELKARLVSDVVTGTVDVRGITMPDADYLANLNLEASIEEDYELREQEA